MTVDGAAVPERADLPRMHRARHAKLQRELEAHDVDALLLLGTSAVAYATGALAPGSDPSRALLQRPVALVVRGEDAPHLFTPFPEGVPPELPAHHVHPPVYPDLDDGAAALATALAGLAAPRRRLGIDEATHAMLRALDGWDLVAATPILGAAKLCKTADELACIRTAQRINEQAMLDVLPLVRPGVRQCDLTARFLGASSSSAPTATASTRSGR